VPSTSSNLQETGPAALRVAALTPFTTIDYPGRLSAVVFVQGCPWRCPYCHNPWMQPREGAFGRASAGMPGISGVLARPGWDEVESLLERRRGLLDAVVFSGGEPCADPALASAMRRVREHFGMLVGLHTSGAYPRRLAETAALADWIGIDVKGPPEDPAVFDRATGRAGSCTHFLESFRAVRESGVPYEARTTAHPDLLAPADILQTADWLKSQGCETYALQIYRPAPGIDTGLAPVAESYPGEDVLSALRGFFPRFILRRS
jgi:pyruvate formate lyase activating enzyme